LAGNIDRARKLLSEGGVGVNAVLQGGWTALLAASQEGHVALVKMLTKAGAAVDKANDNTHGYVRQNRTTWLDLTQ
jgi:ankyrin repeat protein